MQKFSLPLFIATATMISAAQIQAAPLPLIPRPVVLTEREGAPLMLSRVEYSAPPELEVRLAQIARDEWKVSVQKAKSPGVANVRLEIVPTLPAARYTLETGAKNVVLGGRSVAELRVGLQTLRQLAQVENGRVAFAPVAIEDAPRFAHRGLMLDSARHIQSLGGIKRVIDQMERLKFNVFHWHLTDNNGWRAFVPSHPKLTQIGGFLSKSPEVERNGFYTTAQMREIAAYANARGIEIVPEIDVPGHSSALVEAFPEFLCPTNDRPMASTWTSNRTPNHVLCVGNDEVIPFLTTVFKEVAAATGARRVHIGGDEVEEGIWSKCPKCRAVMTREGFTKEHELERWFLSKLSRQLQDNGLQTMSWLERPNERIADVNATIAWHAHDGKDHVEKAVAQGIPVINARGTYAYLDYPQYPGTAKSGWMPLLPLDQVYDFQVVPEVVKQNNSEMILGGACTLWTEEVLESDIDAQLYPRALAVAEQLWTPDERHDKANFKERLALVQPKWEARGVKFAAPVQRDKIISIAGASVESSLGFNAAKFPEYALDGNDMTSYLSDKNAVAGDSFIVRFATPPTASKVTVLTGGYYLWDEANGRVKAAVLESTTDGENWKQIADFKDGFAKAALPAGTRGLRLRLTADQNAKLAISDFRLE